MKYRCGKASTEPSPIHILYYSDPYHATLLETWVVYIHSTHRLDVNTTLGVWCKAAIIVRDPYERAGVGRQIECHSWSRDTIEFDEENQILVGNALNEIRFRIRSQRVEDADHLVTFVGRYSKIGFR